MIRKTLDLNGVIAQSMSDRDLTDILYGPAKDSYQITGRAEFMQKPRAATCRGLAESQGYIGKNKDERAEEHRRQAVPQREPLGKSFYVSDRAKKHSAPPPPPPQSLEEQAGLTKTAEGWSGSTEQWTTYHTLTFKASLAVRAKAADAAVKEVEAEASKV